jgi:hypothetical protein
MVVKEDLEFSLFGQLAPWFGQGRSVVIPLTHFLFNIRRLTSRQN